MADAANPAELRTRYEAVFDGVRAPFAFLDLEAVRSNANAVVAQADGLPIRVASKSVRSLPVLRRILDLDEAFRGILAFTLPEALWLARQGFDDIVIAYPSADGQAIGELTALAAEGAPAPIPMVDDAPHLDLIEAAMASGQVELPVCMEVDVGWWPLRGRIARIGPKRSPVHYPDRARSLAAEIAARP